MAHIKIDNQIVRIIGKSKKIYLTHRYIAAGFPGRLFFSKALLLSYGSSPALLKVDFGSTDFSSIFFGSISPEDSFVIIDARPLKR